MTSPKPRFSLTAPPPKIVVLPDAQFFVRVVPVPGATTSAEVAAQVELALEMLAPFAVGQMYHGYFWTSGSPHALVYAAYRKRFTAEQTESWADAEAVLPAFATIVGAKTGRALLLLHGEESITALQWRADDRIPASVITRPLPPEADAATREALRAELIRAAGETVRVIDVTETPAHDPAADDGELAFRAGEISAAYDRETLDGLDVRDKDDLAVRRRARSRDLLLWRIFVGSAAAIACALLLEFAMIGGKVWQKGRVAVVNERASTVAEINKANDLATRIEELSTKRLLPFEMIDLVKSKMPPSVIFTRVTTTTGALYTLDVRGQTNVPNDVVAYQSLLSGLAECEEVRVEEQDTRGGLTHFRLKVTFKPGVLHPEAQS